MPARSRNTLPVVAVAMALISLPLFAQEGGSNPGLEALRSTEPAVAAEAIADQVKRGEAAIPDLRAALTDDDPVLRGHARTALARITGQWGWDDGLVWKRSLEEAVNPDKPILVLQLFGSFDEEFC